MAHFYNAMSAYKACYCHKLFKIPSSTSNQNWRFFLLQWPHNIDISSKLEAYTYHRQEGIQKRKNARISKLIYRIKSSEAQEQYQMQISLQVAFRSSSYGESRSTTAVGQIEFGFYKDFSVYALCSSTGRKTNHLFLYWNRFITFFIILPAEYDRFLGQQPKIFKRTVLLFILTQKQVMIIMTEMDCEAVQFKTTFYNRKRIRIYIESNLPCLPFLCPSAARCICSLLPFRKHELHKTRVSNWEAIYYNKFNF